MTEFGICQRESLSWMICGVRIVTLYEDCQIEFGLNSKNLIALVVSVLSYSIYLK